MKPRGTGENPLNTTPNILIFFRCPRIIPTLRAVAERIPHNIEKVEKTLPALVGSIRAHDIPPLERIWIVQIASRHSRESLKVLGKEGQVDTYKKEEKVPYTVFFFVHTTCQFWKPKISPPLDPENSSHTLHIVEMSNYIISIVQCYINSSVCLNNSSKSTNSKLNKKTKCKQHRSSQPKGTTIKSPKPTKDFNSSRNCNNHSSTGKVSTSIYIQTNSVHVVSPYQESENCNSSHGIDHSNISKYRFTSKETQYVTNNTKSRQNQDVNFWVQPFYSDSDSDSDSIS